MRHLLGFLLLATLAACNSIAAPANVKKLIEYGWNSPTPVSLDAAKLEASLFDGVILKPSSPNLTFTTKPTPDAAFEPDRKALAAKPSKKLASSFLMVNVYTDDDFDWFDDAHWAAAERNLRNLARTAKLGGLRGLAFDPEPYSKNPWAYGSQPRKATYSFKAYTAKVRERGAAMMRAVQAEYPGITVLNLFFFTMAQGVVDDLAGEAARNKLTTAEQLERSLSEDWAGLWIAFANGWLNAADGGTRLIDGNEYSYYYLDEAAFTASRSRIGTGLLPLVDEGNRAKYAAHTGIAQSLYVDGLANLWKTPRFVGYYLENDATRAKLLEHNTYHALRTTDEFVWVYTENANWWQTPPAWVEAALRSAKTKAASGAPLGFDTAFLAPGKARYDARVEFGGTITVNGVGVRPTRFEPAEIGISCSAWGDQGRYGCVFPKGWSGTVRPVVEGKTLEPKERTYQNLEKGRWDQDFAGK